jgi:hypothetical protein
MSPGSRTGPLLLRGILVAAGLSTSWRCWEVIRLRAGPWQLTAAAPSDWISPLAYGLDARTSRAPHRAPAQTLVDAATLQLCRATLRADYDICEVVVEN